MVKILFLDIDGVLVTRRPGVMENTPLMHMKHTIDVSALSSDLLTECPSSFDD